MDDFIEFLMVGFGFTFMILAVAVQLCVYGGVLYLAYLLVKWVTA